MPKINELNTPTSTRFFSLLEELYPSSLRRYDCPSLSDLDYATLGTLRCLTSARSGQEFLQEHAEKGGRRENVDLFFKALKSKRRLKNLTSLNDSLSRAMTDKMEDPLAELSELKGYHLYAADGHYQAAACFDPLMLSRRGAQKIATGHFFRLNLRTHHLSHLDLSRPKDGKKKDHDATIIKRAEISDLRYQAKTGEKVVYFWDKACINYAMWSRLKSRGIYFVTREKSNSAMNTMSTELFSRDDPRNSGIESDTLVGNGNGEALRRVIYRDPCDGKCYTYLTNEMNLPAWAIALGYKQRWDLEKVFDQFKSKMAEVKSWASSETAKQSHGVFECLAHNLGLIFEHELRSGEGMSDHREEKKKAGRERTRANREGERLKPEKNFINQVFQRATQRTVRYLRWLRTWLYREAPWKEALARLAIVWGIF